MKMVFFFFLAFVSLSVFCYPEVEQKVNTSRSGSRLLTVPDDKESFQFLIYGDRTGGQPEGLKVLAQAVRETNLLAPDFVMTVGDLLNGYTDNSGKWQREADEYLSVMKPLKMPWFPVAGNHDIYWRGSNRPPEEHEGDFERNFGPLWYWFEHKGCGFISLYTDEGDSSKGAKDFTKAAQTQMSPVQLAWLEKSLGEMKHLKQVFVFMHHPRWIVETYPGTNWGAVHQLLVAAKNVRAVFAGHIHRLHYGGKRDGIEYFALAATGASMPGVYPGAGYLHHMNLVTVRPTENYAVSILPVGQVLDHRFFTPERQEDIELARKLSPQVLSPRLAIGENGLGGGVVELVFTNPCQQAVELSLTPKMETTEWFFAPERLSFTLQPGETRRVQQTVVRVEPGFRGRLSMPSLEMTTEYLELGEPSGEILSAGARVPLPTRHITLHAGLRELPTEFHAVPQENQVLAVDGASAFRVDMAPSELPDGPFTLEAWVNPSEVQLASFLGKTEQADYALDLQENVPGFHVFLGGKYASATAEGPAVLPNVWTHLAGVFTGKELLLFVNGKQAARVPAEGKRTSTGLPLYLGAEPNAKGQPNRFLKGLLDEVRLSSVARYTADFTPEKRHTRDAQTVHLFHCDKLLGPFLPSDSSSGSYATPAGAVKLQPAGL
jgi:hypothetical protein